MEEVNKTYKEEEEFLYDEDYDRSDKEILDGYHKDRDKGYQDGVDYVGESMTKKELTSALKSMRSEVVRRSEDGQRVMKR